MNNTNSTKKKAPHKPKKEKKWWWTQVREKGKQLQLPMQSVPISTDVVGSNLDQGDVYNVM
jgi:homoserine acetyltransferase